MPTFTYRALDIAGKTVDGSLEAPDRRGVVQRLSGLGLRPVAIEQAAHAPKDDTAHENIDLYASERRAAKRRLFSTGQTTVALEFLKRLHVLLTAGMAMGDSVRLLSQRLTDPQLKDLCNEVWRRLSEGRTLAASLADFPATFSPSQLHLIEAGEASGTLSAVLARMVAHLEETREVRNRLTSSLAYPIFILFVAFIVIIVLLTFLMPKIQAILQQLGGELPLVTRLLLAGSDFLKIWGPIGLIGLAIGTIALVRWRKTDVGRRRTDLWLLSLPLVRKIYLYANIYATTNLMATLLASGVNTTETLRLVERTIANTILRAKFNAARRQIQEGISMATAIQRVHYMPDLAMDILTVGENTGNLVSSLNDINRIYRDELTRSLNLFTSGTVVIVLGGAIILVAIIAVSLILSILSVSQGLQAR